MMHKENFVVLFIIIIFLFLIFVELLKVIVISLGCCKKVKFLAVFVLFAF